MIEGNQILLEGNQKSVKKSDSWLLGIYQEILCRPLLAAAGDGLVPQHLQDRLGDVLALRERHRREHGHLVASCGLPGRSLREPRW